MGNCLNPASKRRSDHGSMLLPEEEESLSEMRRISQLLREENEEEEDGCYEVAGTHYSSVSSSEDEAVDAVAPAAGVAAEGLKVKIVLTRSELEWLMAQLKSGEQRLEDVLQHMHAAKGVAGGGDKAGAGWRPRLESIQECPETHQS